MRAFLIFTILLIFTATGLAISCYECDSLSNPKCGNCFFGDDVNQIDCDDVEVPEGILRPEATGCLIKYHEGIENQAFFIRRMCYYGELKAAYETCEHSAPDPLVPYLDLAACVVCEDDLCNASNRMLSSMSLLFLLPMVILWRLV